MAEKMEEPVFWLPSEFLTNEEELFLDYKKRDHDFSFGFSNNSFCNSARVDSDEFFAADSIFCSHQTTPNVWKSKNLSGWGIPNSAAEELERMRKVNETMSFYSNKIFAPSQKPNPVQNQNNKTGFSPTRSDMLLLQLQVQAKKVQLLNQQKMMNKVLAQKRMEYYQLKGQTGSEVKKPGLFPETGVKKERTGTGVFIPRRSGNTENFKKPDINKVVSEPVTVTKPTQIHPTEYEDGLERRNMMILAEKQRRSMMRPKQAVMNQEVSLPQDWTY